MKNNKGITLIALVVTIIILLILAGITTILMIGENGILDRASKAGIIYQEQEAREKLELVLMELGSKKLLVDEYNENAYINHRLIQESMIVVEDIVTVNGWQFQIDRSVPKITANLGKGQQESDIQIQTVINNSADYVKATIQIEIIYDQEITYLSIAGEDKQIPKKIDGKYVITQEVTKNSIYTILVKNEQNGYQMAQVVVDSITEDMEIHTKQDLEEFRNKVNSGRTFEGKIVTQKQDIQLEGNQESQWTPIGNMTTPFKGTYEGENHLIEGVYINNSESMQGLFGYIQNATVQNLRVDNSTIIANNTYTAAICAYPSGSTIYHCSTGKNVIIKGQNYTGGIVGLTEAGKVTQCHNEATVSATGNWIGGIAAYALNNQINSCYNVGTIQGRCTKYGRNYRKN